MKKRFSKSLVPKLSLALGTSLLLTSTSLHAAGYDFPSGQTSYNGDMDFSDAPTSITGGTLNIIAGGTLTTPSLTVTTGIFRAMDGGKAFISTLENDDTVIVTGSGSLQISGEATNSGVIELSNGGYLTSGTLASSGTLTVISSTASITAMNVLSGGTLSVTSNGSLSAGRTTTYQTTNISITDGAVASLGTSLIGGDIYVDGGAQLTTSVTSIGTENSHGNVAISGTGTVWRLAGTTDVGIYWDETLEEDVLSSGVISISNGAHLQSGSSPNLIAIVFDSATVGSSRLVIGGTTTPTAAGTIEAFAIAGGTMGYGGVLLFNHTNGTTVENPDAYVFNTRITRNFSVTHTAGHTVLQGNHDYTGSNTIWGGSLTIDGSITADTEILVTGRLVVNGTSGGIQAGGASEVIINGVANGDVSSQLNAQVSGTGTINGNLTNGGFVNPGNSPGTLTVTGNYTQTDEGTLVIEINGNSHDKLVVSGTAFLGGKLLISTSLRSDSKVEILTADGGVVGKFKTVDSGLISYNVEYLPNSVVVETEVSTLTEFAKMHDLNPNERAVAKSLDKAARRGKLSNLLGQLYAMSVDDVETALTLLSPEQISQIFQIGFSGAQTQFTNLERRLSDVRDGAVGFSSNGLALSNSRGTLNVNDAPIANERGGLTLAGWDGKSIVGKQATAPIIEQSRWSFFATGSGEWADVETTSIARGSEFTTGGVTVGADYRINENVVVGISGGYANTQSDLANDGKIDVNSGRGSLYASLFNDGLYLNTIVGGAYNSYETKRGTLGGKAKGDTDGGEFNALLGGGYDYRIGGFSIGPVASLQYTYLGLNSFQETGSSAPQQFSSQSQDSLKSNLGLRASYAWNVGGIVIKPEVRAQWQHEFLDSTAAVESSFVGGAGTFTVNGPSLGRDSLLLDAGIAVQINPALSIFAYYTGEIGRTNYSSNAVNGGIRVSF